MEQKNGNVNNEWFKHHNNNTIPTIQIPKNGYIYVYCSNESQYNVFFDNLQLIHTRGPLVEETHYYPFGLTMAGISSKALAFGNPQNRYKFNKGTELNSDFDLSFYETECRLYDPQIGRFWQIDELAESSWEWSPYTFALNNPIDFNDPLGLDPEPAENGGKVKELSEVVVVSIPKGFWARQRLYYDIMDQLNRRGATIDQILQPSLQEMMYRFDGITKFRNRVSEMTRESDKVFLEIGSFFIPMGWLTKAKYAKYALRLFQAKRGLTGLKALKYAAQFGIKTYRELKKVSPLGSQVHHLIEKRFAQLFGKNADDMASVVLTKEEHQVFTNAWREAIPYATEGAVGLTTKTATPEIVEQAARNIYKEYPEILKALGL